jgi:hypothetical protein
MNNLNNLSTTKPFVFFAIPWLWIGLVVAASVIYRRSKGKAIYPSKPKDSLYYEGWASGHSNSNILTKLGGARNCLSVAVTADSLIIQLRFPFNLMFLPEIYGLEYHISGSSIRSLEKKGRLFWKGVEVQFIDTDGGLKSLSLYLKNTDDFVAAIGKLSAGAGTRSEL